MGFNNGPIDISGGLPVVARVNGYPDTACMVIFNESPFFVNVQLDASNSLPLPAFTADITPVTSGFSGNVTLTPVPYLTAQGQAPATSVFVTTYGSQDPLTRLLFSGMPTGYPIALPRLSNIGNNLNVGTSTTSLVNDNNAIGTQIIEATPTAAGGSCVVITNSGDVTIKGDVAGVLTTLLQIVASSSTVNISSSGKPTNINGNASVAGTTTLTGNVTASVVTSPASTDLKLGNNNTIANVMQAVSGGNTYLKSAADIQMQSPDGTTRLTVNATGISANVDITANGQITVANGVNYNVGRIKDINNGSNLSGTINHGLSGTPNAVLATCNTASSSATVGASSYTSTQFTLTIGGGLNGRWVAYR